MLSRMLLGMSVLVICCLALYKAPIQAAYNYDQGIDGCDTRTMGPFGTLAECNADRAAWIAICPSVNIEPSCCNAPYTTICFF